MKSENKKRYRLYLINPGCKYQHYATQRDLSRLLGKKKMTIPVQLPLLAALTPDHYDITIIDEEMDPLITDPLPDLVGITTLSATADRVVEIGDLYRSFGVPVVMGGSYATFCPEHVLEHADHVVIGEAEGVWEQFLEDFERGCAQRIYERESPPEFRSSPIPRWDLVDVDNLLTIGVETSRGCPFACDFCLVNKMFGRKMRFRDVDDVINEIRATRARHVFFVADNFAINKRYARDLVRALTPLDVTWVCQTSVQIADDEELLREMSQAGCAFILVGFEALNELSLQEVGKHHNKIEEFERAIERIHRAGIHVLASFIVGFEDDTLETFEVIKRFTEKTNLLYSIMNIMSVSPGTALFDRMERQGRTVLVEAAFRNGVFPSAQYNRLSQREILDGFYETLDHVFGWENLDGRVTRLFSTGWFARKREDRSITALQKIKTVFMVLNRFLLTRDNVKRRLFRKLMAMVRKGVLAPDQVFIFLINMEAMNGFIANFKKQLDEVRAQIAKIDKGPWIDDPARAAFADEMRGGDEAATITKETPR